MYTKSRVPLDGLRTRGGSRKSDDIDTGHFSSSRTWIFSRPTKRYEHSDSETHKTKSLESNRRENQ